MATKKVSTGKTTTKKKKISDDLIHERAHQIYLKRIMNGTPGDEQSDWLQAEDELMNA